MQYDLKKLMYNTDQGKENSFDYYDDYHSEYIENCLNTLKNAGCESEEMLIAMAYHDFCLYVYNFRAARDTGMMCKINNIETYDGSISIMDMLMLICILAGELTNNDQIENLSSGVLKCQVLIIMMVATMCRVKGIPHGDRNYDYYASLVKSELQIEAGCPTHLLTEAIAKLKDLENEQIRIS